MPQENTTTEIDWRSVCQEADDELDERPVVYTFRDRKFLDPGEGQGIYEGGEE